MFKKSAVFILHFTPGPQSAVCSLCFTLTGLCWAQMTKPCFVTLEFFDFVKFSKNIELPAI